VIEMTLTEEQANRWETEMRTIEMDPDMSKAAMRVFMQLPMDCGHAVGNLLTCDTPPYGCVICEALEPIQAEIERLREENKKVPMFGN
jgi:hypothetical protein